MSSVTYTFLALGDSYTIGEGVPAEDNFPTQVVSLLKKQGLPFADPLIVAKTGWTTDELMEGIDKQQPTGPYDVVTLLVGVNNQYRGRSLAEYRVQFQELLNKAILFAGGRTSHVVVLSIPDWGVTPYAAGRDRQKIAADINSFNAANRDIAEKQTVHYLDITQSTREAGNDITLLAEDNLHPSGKEYTKWAERLVAIIRNFVNTAG